MVSAAIEDKHIQSKKEMSRRASTTGGTGQLKYLKHCYLSFFMIIVYLAALSAHHIINNEYHYYY